MPNVGSAPAYEARGAANIKRNREYNRERILTVGVRRVGEARRGAHARCGDRAERGRARRDVGYSGGQGRVFRVVREYGILPRRHIPTSYYVS